MATIFEYSFLCTTENVEKKVLRYENEPAPTTCPTNTSHSISSSTMRISNTIKEDIVSIREEFVPTGGNIGINTLKINAVKNTTTQADIVFPMPISALIVKFTSATEHQYDVISMCVGKNTTIGAILAPIALPTTWTSQNYTVGQTVEYTLPAPYGIRVYTCILDTTSNQSPTNTVYWRHGYEITVSPTVLTYTMLGYYIKITDGINTDDLGRVIYINKDYSKIYLEKSPVNTFVAMSLVKQSVYPIKNFELGVPALYVIGEGKIGGSYIPKDVIVSIEYENKSATDDKVIIGSVEYLY